MRKWTNSKPACQCDMFLLSDCSLTDMALYLRILLILAALTGIHSITTVSEVSVKAGGSISIPCLYGSQYIDHVKYLCKGYLWNGCSYAFKTNQQSSGKYSISDDKNRRIFTVTINDLTSEDTHYWCAVEIGGLGQIDEKAYFHLSVTEGTPSLYVDHQKITAFIGENITINCHNGAMSWCRLGDSCVTSSGSIGGTRVTIDTKNRNVFTVTMIGLRTESSGWYYCVKGDFQMPVYVTVMQPTTSPTTTQNTSVAGPPGSTVDLLALIIPLSLLIFTVMVTFVIWFILKRRISYLSLLEQTKAEPSATTREEEVTYSTVMTKKRKTSRRAEEEVEYSDVKHVRKTSRKSDAEMRIDVDVMYSSVVAVKQQTARRGEAKSEDVIYSTLAQP
ncbi:uncharacterized protein LOC104930980 isoform X2 [Larimichthys crocea]|uniref:uncharacterized protein LOC104930980 isoform X2 n=1 Tax=Larimichthys crocea TaxID=215358 RepID=UPI000F5DA7B3|nr:uncharacterized protein LOC104930980 isoform X2 [Larimichthys crocea]